MTLLNTIDIATLNPTVTFHETGFASIASAVSSANLLTPIRLANAYNMPFSTGAGIKIGIVSIGGGFQQSDLAKAMTEFGLTAPTVNVISVNGDPATFTASTLDFDNTLAAYCIASIVPEATINLYVGNFQGAPDFPTLLAWYNAVIERAVDDDCDIISHSWSLPEIWLTAEAAEPDFLYSPLGVAQSHNATVFVATGDNGSSPSLEPGHMGVSYPASSDNVISVGGTYLELDSNDNRVKESVESFLLDTIDAQSGVAGGGGVSSDIIIPEFQTGLTYREYDATDNVTGNPTTLTKRGIPDISSAMNDFVLYFNSQIYVASGTSASVHTMAAMFARIKQLTGKSICSYSFNQLLYANAKNSTLYYEITTGNNATMFGNALNGSNQAIALGYVATTGWNPVTGLGVLNGRALERIVGITGQLFPPVGLKPRPTSGITYPR